MSAAARIQLSFRLALREMRGGLRGFYIFLACIALGTAAIAAVNSVAGSVTGSMLSQGKTLLAGDIRFQINNRDMTGPELSYVKSFGDVSLSDNIRSMARRPDGADQSLAEIKAVDGAYPLYGKLEFSPQTDTAAALSEKDGHYGAVVSDDLLERLNLKVGDTLLVGNLTLDIRARLVKEPDAISEGFALAPRIFISRDALATSGLIQTGSLVEHVVKVRSSEPVKDLKALRTQTDEKFPGSGFRIATSDNAAPALNANIKRFSEFLTLVGLTALIVGGVGVANAVRAYLDAKRGVIATFKCLGAPASTVTLIYLFQIMMIAVIGIVIGLALGALAPIIANRFLAGLLPVDTSITFYPGALALAAAFGILTAIAFAILPLGRARDVPATALFREQGFEPAGWPPLVYMATATVIFLALGGLAIVTSNDWRLAAYFLGGVVGAFIVLRGVAYAIAVLARRSPSFRSPVVRLAIGNIHRPGALTSPVVLSLGLGLTLLVALALIDGNLRAELDGTMAKRAPDFFFVDIQSKDIEGFRQVVKSQAPDGKLIEVPMLRGRIQALKGEDVTKITVPQGVKWVLNGDRGITYSDHLPENSKLEQGAWWPKDYAGEPLVSFAAEEGHELGLKLGDIVTVNVLGRAINARIANFRDVEWQSMGINFIMVFSPNTFKGAPHSWLASLSDPNETNATQKSVMHAVTVAYPGITTINIKDAIKTISILTGQLALAIRVAASVALIASVLVLSGALAAGNRARIHDAVILKTLGATRKTLIAAFSLEYALLGLATAIFALLAGGVAAWSVIHLVMTLNWHFDPLTALATVVAALVITVGAGLAGTWRVLGQKAAPILREL